MRRPDKKACLQNVYIDNLVFGDVRYLVLGEEDPMRNLRLAATLLSLSVAGYAQGPSISAGGVVNGATFEQGRAIAVGSLVSIFGTNLGSRMAEADSIPLSTAMAGVTVNFVTPTATIAAPLLVVMPSQINLQVPWDAVPQGTTGTVNVVVVRDGVSSPAMPVSVGSYSPGVFTSGGRAVAVNVDGTLAWPTGAVQGAASRPAKIGDVITIYATGLGPVDSPIANGQNSLDRLRHTAVAPTVLIGGITAPIHFAGLSPQFVGVNQLNVVVPDVAPGDALPLQIQIGGITSPERYTIAVTR
jgi:uncharacterized protein (TIGR03437 family)